MSIIQVTTTIDTQEGAQYIADTLLQRRLAACVQIVGPLTSTYWWDGAIKTTTEWLCLIKSLDSQFSTIEAVIHDLHPYNVPELVATPIVAGSADYMHWLGAELAPSQ